MDRGRTRIKTQENKVLNPALRGASIPAGAARLSHRAASKQALTTSPDVASHTTSALRSAPRFRLSTLPTHQQVCRGASTRRRQKRLRLWLLNKSPGHSSRRFLRPTSLRPSQVLSNCTNTTNANIQLMAVWRNIRLTPWRFAQVGFQGPRIPRRLPYSQQLSSFLACSRHRGSTPFVSSLSHQFVTSLPARVLHRQAIRRPLVSPRFLRKPSGPPSSSLPQVTGFLSDSFSFHSDGLRPFGTPQACRSRHRYSPLELPLPVHVLLPVLRNQFKHQSRFQRLRASPLASVPLSPNPLTR